MKFAILTHLDTTGKTAEACGSDALVHLDGRRGVSNHIATARESANRLRAIGREYNGAAFYSGESVARAKKTGQTLF